MNYFKRPSELEVKSTLVALIYGQPGLGKSTLACSAPGAVMLDFDGGVSRISGAHQVPTLQVHSWEEASAALDEAATDPTVLSIIVDTAGKMLAYMEEYIKRTDPKKTKTDGSLSQQGYGTRKTMFINFIKRATTMGRNVIFVAHESEQKRGDETVIRPEIGGSSTADLLKELDLVGYMEMAGRQRTISFSPYDKFYAKNACHLPDVINVPQLTDNEGNPIADNDFLSRIIDAYQAKQRTDREKTAQFEELVYDLKGRIAAIETAEDANNFIEGMKTIDHIYNSRAVILTAMNRRMEQLGLKYDKTTKRYA